MYSSAFFSKSFLWSIISFWTKVDLTIKKVDFITIYQIEGPLQCFVQ